MGYGHRKRYGRFVEAALNRVAAASSSRDSNWLLGFSALLLQHIISRWVHSGRRKCFQSRIYEDRRVYLLQNIGDPSETWINDKLKKNLGLDPRFFDEHLALVYDGSRVRPTAGSSAHHQFCPYAWHVGAVQFDQQALYFVPLPITLPFTTSELICVSFQRTDRNNFLVLFDVDTKVPFLERCHELTSARDTLKNIILMLEWLDRALSRFPTRYRGQSALATILKRATISTVLAFLMSSILCLWLALAFLVWSIRLFDPRGCGLVQWPSRERTILTDRIRPRSSKFFDFLEDWLSGPVNSKMIAYMTSITEPQSCVYRLAESNLVWELSSSYRKHEMDSLSTRSEELERQALERPNFNTLRQLVQCRRTTRKLQDGTKNIYQQMPAITLDWKRAIESFSNRSRVQSDRHPHELHWEHFPPFLSRIEENPIESYHLKGRVDPPTPSGERTEELKLKSIEDSLTRSMGLLQEAIAVQTSDRALWLALIATFYFPATLATGIFGMNLSLIDGKPYWWAVVVCGILFVPNLALLVYVFGRR